MYSKNTNCIIEVKICMVLDLRKLSDIPCGTFRKNWPYELVYVRSVLLQYMLTLGIKAFVSAAKTKPLISITGATHWKHPQPITLYTVQLKPSHIMSTVLYSEPGKYSIFINYIQFLEVGVLIQCIIGVTWSWHGVLSEDIMYKTCKHI